LAQDEQLAEQLSGLSIELFVDRWYRQPLFATLKAHPVFSTVVSRRFHGDPTVLARALRGFSVGRQRSMWKHLGELKMPTLCVAGGLDHKYTEIMTRAADLCPYGKLRIIDGAGHAVHLEKPGELAEALRPFILDQR
jgi:2-succinyl-6-hydroxy-2,4-cyclohexadiene-1-carboxylate synthase